MQLFERDNLLALLHRGFQKILSGEGHSFFILGEAGIGKTSLVKAFLKEIEEKSIQYTGACDPLFTPRPLAPLYDIALQVKEDWPQKVSSGSSRTGWFSEFAQQLTNKEKPVILFFEDIHWADEATLDFIKFFARRISKTNCLFLLTLRDNEISYQHLLRKVLSDIATDTFTRLHLTPLSREAVYKMAVDKGYEAEDVYSISGGNPFYVNEILASYSPGVPDNIKDSILSVYDRQKEGTKNAWEIFSVIPEGLEINRFAKLRSSWDEAIDHCFAMNILMVENGRIIFKHELYRRTIEESLSPFKWIELNKKLLDLFLESFEQEGEIERIVHYAKNANENEIVAKYAPMAARQAASLGAHIESAKLYLTAIEFAGGYDTGELVKLYEAYAWECYLTNQIKDAIVYQVKALHIRQQKNEVESACDCLRFLSRLWWLDGNRDEAEKYAIRAIAILQSYPASKAKAMAYSNMSQLKMHAEELESSVEWGMKAIEMAKEMNDEAIFCHALSNVGSAQWKKDWLPEKSKSLLLQSLDIALKSSFHEQASWAYSNIISNYLASKQYESAKQFLEDISYYEERHVEASKKYTQYLKARLLLDTGRWKEAALIAAKLLADPGQLGVVKTCALIVQSTIKIRKGEPDALICLQEARLRAFKAGEYQRMMPVAVTLLEYEWLTGKELVTAEELQACIDLTRKVRNMFVNSEFAFWLQKARRQQIELKEWYEPYYCLQEQNPKKAAAFWEDLCCPFEQALALFEGGEEDKKNALSVFQELEATAVYEKAKLEMRSCGIKKIPRGLRESTRSNPAQLTNRELDVLQLLSNAAQNKDIADALFISPKTVDHHISSILFKLDVNSRARAVAEAIRLGILKQV